MKHNPTPPNAKTTSSTPVVAAIDLGYGFTKYAVHTAGKPVEDSFPSFAPSATGAGSLGGSGALSKLRVVPVEVNNKTYLVGVDSVSASDGRQERHRDPAYCTSDKACIALTTEDMGHQLKIYEMDAIDTAKGAKRLRVLLKVFDLLFGKNTIKAVNSSKDKPLDPNAAASAMMVIAMVVITLMAARVF